jgi:hypothetical protein
MTRTAFLKALVTSIPPLAIQPRPAKRKPAPEPEPEEASEPEPTDIFENSPL